jgi:hypothetical protein
MFANTLVRDGRVAEAQEMVDRGILIAEREGNRLGVGLLRFMSGKLLELKGQTRDAYQQYQAAQSIGTETGHLWLEAGALQGLVRTDSVSKDAVSRIEKLLRSLELVHWVSGGSAPAPWMVDMVDSFWAVDALATQLINENDIESVIEANSFLAEVGLDGPVRGAMARLRHR